MSKASRPFSLSPVRVSKQTREMILTLYPNLRDHLNALAYWRILQYILFCNYPDRRTNKQILSYNVVASLVGAKPHDTRFRAGTWLDDFSGDVFPLDPSEWNYKEGRARTIDPEIDPRIWAALERDRERCRNEEDAGWVLFDTGELASRRKWKAAIRAHDKAILQAEVIPSGHPGLPVMEFLNNQPPHSLIKIIKANLPRLDAAVEAMPRHTEHERLRYQYSRCLADHLLEHQKMRYTVLENSPRVYSRQMTVNQLPRELRKIALSGAVELDLKACQLAIVARLWGISGLQTGLEELQAQRGSYWKKLQDDLGTDAASKPILKDITYGLLFGMGRERMRNDLTNGNGECDGIGKEKALLFLEHPWIKEILQARKRVRAQVKAEGGALDAYGRWIEVQRSSSSEDFYWLKGTGKKDPIASVMAQVVQSHELKLMSAVLPVVENEPSIRVVSWLHDGVTVAITESVRRNALVKRLQEAVRVAACGEGYVTELEATDL